MGLANWRNGILVTLISVAMAACGPEADTTSNPQNPSNVPPQPAPNAAPIISGTPAVAVAAGVTYMFQVGATDANGDTLTFSATGLPAWASINPQTGMLFGTPSEANVGTTANIVVSVSDGKATASLPAFLITVSSSLPPPTTPPPTPPPPPPTNNAPVISGTPSTSAVAGSAYSFTPAASDADGNMLTFSITNKPAWATFSLANGSLTGTPASGHVGSYASIVISVSDGTVSRSLAAFTINVTQPAATGTAALSWTAPTQNTDGSALTDLAGYRVYHGTSASALNDIIQVQGASSTSYTFNQLSSGTHYFAVAAYTNGGVESALSGVGSKAIP